MPIDRVNERVDVLLVPISAAADAPQNAAGETRFEIRMHRQRQIAGEGDATVGGNDSRCAGLRELLGQDRFEAARAGSEVALGHGAIATIRTASSRRGTRSRPESAARASRSTTGRTRARGACEGPRTRASTSREP